MALDQDYTQRTFGHVNLKRDWNYPNNGIFPQKPKSIVLYIIETAPDKHYPNLLDFLSVGLVRPPKPQNPPQNPALFRLLAQFGTGDPV